jgi:DNA/RNA endonuclease YhcR with UshA esterase domain
VNIEESAAQCRTAADENFTEKKEIKKMKMRFALAVLAVCAVAFCGMTYAADTSDTAQPAVVASETPAAPAAPPAEETKVAITTVVGKVAVKTEMVDGKKSKIVSIVVSEANDEEGAAVADLNAKSLEVTGDKAADVQKLDGKEVEAKGVVTEMKSIEVESVMEKNPVEETATPPAAPATENE